MAPIHRTGQQVLVMALSLTVFFATGCATLSPPEPPPPLTGVAMPVIEEDASWWVYRFRIDWPEDAPADMSLDLLLAHVVVKPHLERFAPRLAYWRFHRRAARDAAGHQFSFLFYADPATAAELYAALASSPELARLQDMGLVTRIVKDDPRSPVRPGIADTSDASWSPMLQRQWPAYIMGVSRMWLGLIDETVADLPPELRDGDDLPAVYREAHARVSRLWFKEGQHAFLHHLSAVFGYQELLVVKPMRF